MAIQKENLLPSGPTLKSRTASLWQTLVAQIVTSVNTSYATNGLHSPVLSRRVASANLLNKITATVLCMDYWEAGAEAGRPVRLGAGLAVRYSRHG